MGTSLGSKSSSSSCRCQWMEHKWSSRHSPQPPGEDDAEEMEVFGRRISQWRRKVSKEAAAEEGSVATVEDLGASGYGGPNLKRRMRKRIVM